MTLTNGSWVRIVNICKSPYTFVALWAPIARCHSQNTIEGWFANSFASDSFAVFFHRWNSSTLILQLIILTFDPSIQLSYELQIQE